MTNVMIGAYALWLFFGWCSAHRFFLGRTKMAFRQLGLLIGGVVCLVIAAWGSGDVTTLRGWQDIEFERVLFMILGVVMFGAWNLWLLADAVLIALIVLDEERKTDFAREMGFAQPKARPTVPLQSIPDTPEDPPAGMTLSHGRVMPWRQDKDDVQEIYKARGD